MTAPIVVPLDGTERALVALPIAQRLAELLHATLHLIHVSGEDIEMSQALARIGLSGVELRGSVLETRSGDPGTSIVALARELGASFVVMCTQTDLHAKRDLGKTVRAVLDRATCPVVLVRPERGMAPWSPRKILFPHDGSPQAAEAIAGAADLARAASADLDVLHVAASDGRTPLERGSLPTPRYVDQPQHEWPAWVQEFVERIGAKCSLESVKMRITLTHGTPGDEVVRFASEHGSDLVVLSWLGEWSGSHAMTLKAILAKTSSVVMVKRARA